MITPGPWRRSLLDSTTVQNDTGRIVATTGVYQDNISHGAYHYENEGNALAISLVPEMIEALESIAVRSDTYANEYLERTGSYAMFDEPASVETARSILSKLEGKTDE